MQKSLIIWEDSAGEAVERNPFRYRGYYYDTETELYYLNSRYYDPSISRFISADNAQNLGNEGEITGYNLYSYCGNNPIIRRDTSGESFVLALGAMAFGAAVNVAGQYVSDVVGNIKEGKTGIDVFKATSGARDYAAAAVGGAVSAIPGPNWLCTIAIGAIGSVVTDAIRGNINSTGDIIKSALLGAFATTVGIAASKIQALVHVEIINAMPRTAKKQFVNNYLYHGSQAVINENLKKYNALRLIKKIALVESNLLVFRAGIYSTLTSSIIQLF